MKQSCIFCKCSPHCRRHTLVQLGASKRPVVEFEKPFSPGTLAPPLFDNGTFFVPNPTHYQPSRIFKRNQRLDGTKIYRHTSITLLNKITLNLYIVNYIFAFLGCKIFILRFVLRQLRCVRYAMIRIYCIVALWPIFSLCNLKVELTISIVVCLMPQHCCYGSCHSK
jgi:hypothetical protein